MKKYGLRVLGALAGFMVCSAVAKPVVYAVNYPLYQFALLNTHGPIL